MTRSQAAKRLRWTGLIVGVALVALETLRFRPWRLLYDGRPDVPSILFLFLFLANIFVAWKSSRIGGILFFIQAAVWPAVVQVLQRLHEGAGILSSPISLFIRFGLSMLVVGFLFYLSHEEEQKSQLAERLQKAGLIAGIVMVAVFLPMAIVPARAHPSFYGGIVYIILFSSFIYLGWKSPRLGGTLFLIVAAGWLVFALFMGFQEDRPFAIWNSLRIVFWQFGLFPLIPGILFYLTYKAGRKGFRETRQFHTPRRGRELE